MYHSVILAYPQLCNDHYTTMNFRTFSSPKETLYPLAVILLFPQIPVLQPNTKNTNLLFVPIVIFLSWTFCISGIIYVRPFVTDFFHLA